MQIAVADPGRGGAHQDLMLAGIVDIDLLDGKRLMRTTKHGGFHCFDSSHLTEAAQACSQSSPAQRLEFADVLIAAYTRLKFHSNIRTVRATSPAFIARNA